MKFEMTERDKKLLIFLAVFVIVVCIGYWGVFPVIKEMNQINFDMQEELAKRDVNEMKTMQLPMLEMETEELEEQIKDAKKDFYGMMNSDEIDKLFTTMALDYNLYAYSLGITMPENQVELEAYQYSDKYKADQAAREEEELAMLATATSSEESSTESAIAEVDAAAMPTFDDSDFYSSQMVGIYAADITMRLEGDEAALQKLIDDLSVSEKKLRVLSYSWDQDSAVDIDENGNYSISYKRILNLKIQIYMCED